jgi:sugar lactone lactonase YvrE
MATVVNAFGTATTSPLNLSGAYNGHNGAALGNAPASNILSANSASFRSGVACVASDGAGTLYIADTGNNVIRKVINGIITTAVGYPVTTVGANGIATSVGISGYAGDGGAATEALLAAPEGVNVDSTGTQLCIADTGNHVVRQVDLSKNSIVTIAGLAGDNSSDSNLPIAGWQSRSNTPTGCAFDTAGNVYIADAVNNRILKVDTKGIMSQIAGGGTDFVAENKSATTAKLTQPTAINVDTAGNIFFTDSFGLVRKLTPVAPAP